MEVPVEVKKLVIGGVSTVLESSEFNNWSPTHLAPICFVTKTSLSVWMASVPIPSDRHGGEDLADISATS